MINSLYSLYEKKLQGDKEAEIIIELRNFLTSIIKKIDAFDPATGVSLPTDIDSLLRAINSFNSQSNRSSTKDYLYKISDFCLGAFEDLYKQMKEESIRTHQIMPVYRVRELDSSDMMALSRRPGRTIKEKLSGKPFMQAVKRDMSCNILENRLLKEFAYRIRELLETRANAIHDDADTACEELLYRSDKFLHLEICEDIFDWNNATPNNVLLQDKTYGKIWKAWKEINSIDDYIQYDSENLDLFISLFLFWSILGKLSQYKNFHFIQQPIDLNYQNIQIKPVYDITGYCDKDKNHLVTWTFKFLNNSFIFTSSLKQKITVSILNQKVYVNQKEIGNGNLSIKDLVTTYNFISDKIYVGELKKNNTNTVITNLEDISFDLYSAKPYYAIDSKQHGQFDEKFLIQTWNYNDTKYIVSLQHSNACYTDSNKHSIKTDSLISFLDDNHDNNESNTKDNSLISINLLQIIYSHFQCDRLRLVVPDSISDFALQPIRKNANAVFPKVYTIPRSIGAVFKFQSSKDFSKAAIKNGDFIFVLDRINNAFSITPIQAEVCNKLNGKNIPANIRWVKHPTFTKHLDKNEELIEYLTSQISDSYDFWNSLNTNNIQKDFTSFGLMNNNISDNIFIQTQHITNSIISRIRAEKVTKAMIAEARNRCKINSSSKVYVIKTSDLVYTDSDVICNSSSYNPTVGSGILSEWQKNIPDISLWREHLPQLLMKVQLQKPINLCLNQEVEPVFGKRIKLQDIKIPLVDGTFGEVFVLKSGQKSYQFPLIIGDGASKVKYQAKLCSPVFPLQSDLDCKLEMYYTYGKDNPFELYFLPLEDTSIPHISVEWILDDPANRPLIFPSFPPRLSIDEIHHSPDGRDLFQWAKQQLNSLAYTLNKRYDATKPDYIEWFSRTDRNGDCFEYLTSTNSDGNRGTKGDIFVHELSFEDGEFKKFARSGCISYNLTKDNSGKYKAKNITSGFSLSKDRLTLLPGQLYFPLLTIFGNYSLDSFDQHYSAFFSEKIEEIKSIHDWYLGKENSTNTTNSLFSILCCFGNDSWKYIGDEINTYVEDPVELVRKYRDISFALGTAQLPEQRMVINKIVQLMLENSNADLGYKPFDSILCATINILSSVAWKNEAIILELSPAWVPALFYGVLNFLDSAVKKIDITKRFMMPSINASLEFLLALLRYRQQTNKSVNKILCLENPDVKRLIKYIKMIDKKIKEADLRAEQLNNQQISNEAHNKVVKVWPKTRLNFGDLPQKGNKDALCYVLESYLREEELTSQIVIKGFTESE